MSLLDKYNEGIKNKLSNIGNATSNFLNTTFNSKKNKPAPQNKNSNFAPKNSTSLDKIQVIKNFNSTKVN